ncbi:MAG: hypothetical protein QW728_05695 [Thermoplasmata archaeon]
MIVLLLAVPAKGSFENYTAGEEKNVLGHSYSEEYWTASSINNTTADGATIEFAMSYVNKYNFQAFLVALKTHTKDNVTSTIPYQLFGMHYYTNDGREVGIGAIFAFLMAWNETNNNSLPDANETKFYVYPWGAAEQNRDYTPEVSVLPVEKKNEDVYEFGMSYKNLYAFAFENPFAALLLRSGYFLKFDELTIKYRVTFDKDSGVVKAETFYIIGQVRALWAILLGVPVQLTPDQIPPTMGIAAVHYVATYTSGLQLANRTGSSVATNITAPTENLTLNSAGRKIFDIGFRGNYSTYDNDTLLNENEPAVNAIIAAKPADYALIAWQAGFSLGLFTYINYGISPDLRDRYNSPKDLLERGSVEFRESRMWYGVCFVKWHGKKIVHDPTYSAFFNPNPDLGKKGACGGAILAAMLLSSVMIMVDRRKK